MAESEKDRIARQTADLRVIFDTALSNKRKYPVAEFKAFVQSARRYIEITAGDPMIHKSVVRAVNGLREFLETFSANDNREKCCGPGRLCGHLIALERTGAPGAMATAHTKRGAAADRSHFDLC